MSESIVKHDGLLKGQNTYTVEHMFGLLRPSIASVKIGHDEVSNDEVWLSPEQALSLLAWLEQERETLERLVAARLETQKRCVCTEISSGMVALNEVRQMVGMPQ